MVPAGGVDGVSGSLPIARRVVATTLLVIASIAPTACATDRAEVWVHNLTDRTYALLLATADGPDRLAFVEILPASRGLAHQRAGRPVDSFVLFNADCRPVAGGAIKGMRTDILIDDRGVALETDGLGDPAEVLAAMRPSLTYREVEDCRDPIG
jgi:hypothetical protein